MWAMWGQCCADPAGQVTSVEHVGQVALGDIEPAACEVADVASGPAKAGDAKVDCKQVDSDGAQPKLTVHIVGARGLRDADWLPGTGKSDSFVVLSLRGAEVHRTEVIQDCLEPVWNDEVALHRWQEGDALDFKILDQDAISCDVLGKVHLESSSFDLVGYNGEVEIQEAGNRDGTKAYLRLRIKLRGVELPPDPPNEFEISLNKERYRTWGLDLDTQDNKLLFVTEVKHGPFAKHNDEAKPEDHVIKGDFIMSVNGTEGSPAALLNEFKLASKAVVGVCRSFEIAMIFERTNQKTPLGLRFPEKPVGEALVILEVEEEGVAASVNEGRDEELKLKAGDRIVSVAGERGKAADLMSQIERTLGKFQVKVVRSTRDAAWEKWNSYKAKVTTKVAEI